MRAIECLSVLALLSSNGAMAQDDSPTDSKPMTCDFNTDKIKAIPTSRFSVQCFAPRADHESDFVRIPKFATEFVTSCPVKLDDVATVPPDHDCAPNDPTRHPFRENDQIMVTHWGSDQFTLVRLRDQFVVELAPAPMFSGGTPYLTGSKDGIEYAVYFEYKTGDPAEKVYRIETFDSDSRTPRRCDSHKPSHKPKVVPCAGPVATRAEESSTSTGGEPPPND